MFDHVDIRGMPPKIGASGYIFSIFNSSWYSLQCAVRLPDKGDPPIDIGGSKFNRDVLSRPIAKTRNAYRFGNGVLLANCFEDGIHLVSIDALE